MRHADATPDPIPRWLARLSLYVIAFLAFGDFDMALFGRGPAAQSGFTHVNESASPQQYLILALWLFVIGLSFLPGVLRWRPHTRGLGWLLAFYSWAALSPCWSPDLLHSAPKAIVFATCSFGVWRMTAVFSIAEFLDIVRRSLFALMLACAAALLLAPTIAVSHGWMHTGDWKGMFAQKQELGIAGAYFLLLVLMRLISRFRWIDAAAFLLALALVVGSGSRGGLIIALGAPLALLVARRSGRVSQVFAFVVTVEICVALAEMTYLLWTGDRAIHIGDLTLNISERTYIWSFALAHWQQRPWLGFGLNGFWTSRQNLWDFARIHNWVINDYHSGYVAVLVQTGAAGFVLFLLMVRHLCLDLRHLLRQRGPKPGLDTAVGLLIMLFTINMTETIFSRSTNFDACIFSFLAMSIFMLAHPLRVSQASPIAATAD